jgi:hypothetical protein
MPEKRVLGLSSRKVHFWTNVCNGFVIAKKRQKEPKKENLRIIPGWHATCPKANPLYNRKAQTAPNAKNLAQRDMLKTWQSTLCLNKTLRRPASAHSKN